ncbi:TetR/AcrR family transcriptional regulator [Kibdelosporangium phytohabitans]|uniref:TetR family transcriptional regulator n=1 Tax=Kibdelosporangium phytohabitans TaxID=860235 RepID=A0A0N9I4V1_9PSEU|nr:TetR/AcrR family transcriptional regulator [Kibdelosporangium phytohabitans]ALG10662.1 TetR family transcriptional regulator [Kibdelosporangium phytohabitans]MBE1461785.1 AcrR family transcriptional regulator [Kibdelosporangium phytohabitans]
MPADSAERETSRTPRTARGVQTRSRIVQSAARLFYVKGVSATTLDDVRTASGTSKSQLYNHFQDKAELIHAVIDVQAKIVLAREEDSLGRVRTLGGLRRWRNAVVQTCSLQGGAYGCTLGSMSIELSDSDEKSREALAAAFDTWQRLLAGALIRLRELGVLSADAKPDDLATGLLAALQGGYLLAQNGHNSRPMAVALDMALAHVESFARR